MGGLPILSQLLKSETADSEVRSTAYQPKPPVSPPIAISPASTSPVEVNEALARQQGKPGQIAGIPTGATAFPKFERMRFSTARGSISEASCTAWAE